MKYLKIERVLELHQIVITQSGGSSGLRDRGGLESAVAQPMMTFDGIDLYPTLTTKAAALGYSLIQNHPFVDGNKRIGHAAIEALLMINEYEISCDVDEQEQVILAVACGQKSREELAEWLESRIVPFRQPSEDSDYPDASERVQ